MGVHHALRVARGAAGVTHAGGLIFVSHIPFGRLGLLQQRFIFVHLHAGHAGWHLAFAVVHKHQMFDRGESGHERLEYRPQRSVAENHFVFGVIHDVGHLLGKQAKVQSVQHTVRARCSKIQLEVSG